MRVLLVEDDDLNQALVRAILAGSKEDLLRGADLVTAAGLADAEEVIASGPVDIVLLDMRLPDGSGLELARHLRERQGPPVIAMTGAPAELTRDALRAGCRAVLAKPYHASELRDLIMSYLPAGPSPAAESLAAGTGEQGQGETAPGETAPAAPPPEPAAGTAPERGGDSEFVSRASHEMRNPINTILGFAELLSMDGLSDEHHEWVTMILKAGHHLSDFLDHMSDMSDAGTHNLTMSMDPVPVEGVIIDAIDLVRPLANSLGVTIDPAPRTQHHVYADRQRLRQVLLNLLTNAVKYNHPLGRVTVGIFAEHGARQLRVTVSDTGRGISDADLSQVFTPFQRLDAAMAGIEGVGLGLALSRQLIEAMGGTVGAISTRGVGSQFWIQLPMASTVALAPDAHGVDPVARVRSYDAPRTILYAEDLVTTVRLIEQVLRQRPSTRLIPAMLGAIALDLAAEHHPDLILLDLNLPDMTGEQLLRRLQSDPATASIPVVVLSADTSEERIDRLLAAGARDYLTKPIGVRAFLTVIDEMLGQPSPAIAREAEPAARVSAAPAPEAGLASPKPMT